MSVYGLDYETSSEADLSAVGGYRYANDPSTRILMFAICKDDGPVLVWDSLDPDGMESEEALDLFREAVETKSVIRAFNAQFEVAVSRYVLTRQLGIPEPDLSQWRCSMAMCNRAALRSNLKKALQDLDLPEDKDAAGDDLIDIFCKGEKAVTLFPPPGAKDPDTIKPLKNGKFTAGRKPKNHKTYLPLEEDTIRWDWLVKVQGELVTLRRAWGMFLKYCRKDVIAERALAAKLHKFELTGEELAAFQFDLRMNYKGVPVNRKALAHADKLANQYSERLGNRFINLTGLRHTQPRILGWLQERGYTGENLQADTIDKALEDTSNLTPEGAEALKMRSLLSFAALKKIPAMLACACDDGYVRGTTLYHGARTGRATGRLIQPQNMKKSTIEDSKTAYALICDGCSLEELCMLWESPLEVIASCARHFIQPHEGTMLSADFVGVESRIGPWLCGQKDKLDSILRGECQYKVMASKIAFKIPYEEVTKDQRQVGKVLELQCIYGTGGEGMRDSLRGMGIEKPLKECNANVSEFRRVFSKYPECWDAMETAAKDAITDGKTTFVANGKLAFGRVRFAGIIYLVMRLPSGRRLYYPRPEVKRVFRKYSEEQMLEDPWKRERGGYYADSISFYGKVPLSGHWSRIYTWGSRLFENACFTEESEVLTEGGWLPITEINGLRVFDGVEFVSHGGLDPKLSNAVIRLDGLGVTRNHEILTSKGWTHAENTEIEDAYQTCLNICTGSRSENVVYQGHDRAEMRPSHRGEDRPGPGKSEGPLGVSVRLWGDRGPHDLGALQPSTSGHRLLLVLLFLFRGEHVLAWDVPASGLRGLPEHVGPMPVADSPSVSQLRGAGDPSMPAVAGVFRELLVGHETGVSQGAYFGSPGQQWGLREVELPLDVNADQQSQQTVQRQSEDSPRAPLPDRDSPSDRNQEKHAILPVECRSPEVGGPDPSGECYQQVFDILNCGPRNRFLVRAPGGRPIIAHNCQAIGADFLNYGCLQAEEDGHDIRMIIHDEILGMENGLSLESFMEAFCRKQPWAHDFPLESSGSHVPFYLKD
jgi:DNA polymerase